MTDGGARALQSQSCTLHEANIIGSVMAKTSIPVLHSAAAMLKIAELPYSGAAHSSRRGAGPAGAASRPPPLILHHSPP